MLQTHQVDEICDYVKSQQTKLAPILRQIPHKPNLINQLVESFCKDLLIYLLETIGQDRTDDFKRKYMGFVE
jgi:hypothetical protein